FNVLFALNAVAFLISAALLLSIILPPSNDRSSVNDALLERFSSGIRAYLQVPRLRGLLALSMAVAAAGSMVIVNTVVYVQQFLNLDQSSTALAMAAFGLGSMCAAMGLPRLLTHISDRTVMMSGASVMAISLAAGTMMPGFVGLLLIWSLLGFGFGAVHTPTGRLLRASSQEGNRTAYFAAQFALSHACWLLTYPLAGWLSSTYGLRSAFVTLLFITVISIFLALVVWPQGNRDAPRFEPKN
ncbi:MAG: MFS transporter, partial [Pseudomonadota bacterium]